MPSDAIDAYGETLGMGADQDRTSLSLAEVGLLVIEVKWLGKKRKRNLL